MKFDKHYFSEVDDYAIRVYSKRFPDSTPLGDITQIDGTKLPKGEWIIAGGFPCQDISVAGKGAGLAGSRSGLWFEYARLIGELRPRYAIMENVGALTFRGLGAVLGSLAEIGYDAEWQDIRASDVGAPHRRERIWIVAYPMRDTRHERRPESEGQFRQAWATDGGDDVAYPGLPEPQRWVEATEGQQSGRWRETRSEPASCGDMVNLDSQRCQEQSDRLTARARDTDSEHGGTSMADAADRGNVRRHGQLEPAQGQVREHRGSPQDGCREWWATEPALGGLVDGLPAGLGRFEGRVCRAMPERVAQLKCLGNSIVPQIAQLIFEHLTNITEAPTL